MSTHLPIPRPRQPLAIEQADTNAAVDAMLGHVTEFAAGADFNAMPAEVRCEIMLAINGLHQIVTCAAVLHPRPVTP